MIWPVAEETKQSGKNRNNLPQCSRSLDNGYGAKRRLAASHMPHTQPFTEGASNSARSHSALPVSDHTEMTAFDVSYQMMTIPSHYGDGLPFHNARTEKKQTPLILVGLTAICAAVGAGEGTVKRWIREDGFPARRCSDGTYRADPEAVRRWFALPATPTQ